MDRLDEAADAAMRAFVAECRAPLLVLEQWAWRNADASGRRRVLIRGGKSRDGAPNRAEE